jgi:uncharacterized protein (TIGR03067 family)
MKAQVTFFMVIAWAVSLVSGVDFVFAGDTDAKLLQGKWRVVSAKRNGLDYAKDKTEKMFVTITDEELRLAVEGTASEQAAKFLIDPKKNPRHIDFTKQTRDREWEKGLLWEKLFTGWKQGDKGPVPTEHKAEGIYKLESDTLTMCWRTTKGKDLLERGVPQELSVRPSVFQSVLYYHQFLFVLKRVEAGK